MGVVFNLTEYTALNRSSVQTQSPNSSWAQRSKNQLGTWSRSQLCYGVALRVLDDKPEYQTFLGLYYFAPRPPPSPVSKLSRTCRELKKKKCKSKECINIQTSNHCAVGCAAILGSRRI
jgi:hypothetical protein